MTFVTVKAGGWDTHGNNFEELKKQPAAASSTGPGRPWCRTCTTAACQNDVLVMAWASSAARRGSTRGAGRDHWPGAMSVVYAGGGLKMGQAIGTTDAKAEYPRSGPITPGGVLSTMYHVLGIDQNIEYLNEAQRPVKILNTGTPIRELVG